MAQTAIRNFVRHSPRVPGGLPPTTARQLADLLANMRRLYSEVELAAAFDAFDHHVADHALPHGTAGIGGGGDGLTKALYNEYVKLVAQPLSLVEFRQRYVKDGRQQLELMRELCLNRMRIVEGYGRVEMPDPPALDKIMHSLTHAEPMSLNVRGPAEVLLEQLRYPNAGPYFPQIHPDPSHHDPCWTLEPWSGPALPPPLSAAAGAARYPAMPLVASPFPYATLLFKLQLAEELETDQPILRLDNGGDSFTLHQRAGMSQVVVAALQTDLNVLTAMPNLLVELLDAYTNDGADGLTDFRSVRELEPEVSARISAYLAGPRPTGTGVLFGEHSFGSRRDGLTDPLVATAEHLRVLSHRPPTATLEEGLGAVTVTRHELALYYLYRGGLSVIAAPSYGLSAPLTSLTLGLPLGPGPGSRALRMRLYPDQLSPSAIATELSRL